MTSNDNDVALDMANDHTTTNAMASDMVTSDTASTATTSSNEAMSSGSSQEVAQQTSQGDFGHDVQQTMELFDILMEWLPRDPCAIVLTFLKDAFFFVAEDGSYHHCPREFLRCSQMLAEMMDKDPFKLTEYKLACPPRTVSWLIAYLTLRHVNEPETLAKPLPSDDMFQVAPRWQAQWLLDVTNSTISQTTFFDPYNPPKREEKADTKAPSEQEALFSLILISNQLHIPCLLELLCAKVASMLKGKTPTQIRQTFNITNDFTPEEEEAVRAENAWAEE